MSEPGSEEEGGDEGDDEDEDEEAFYIDEEQPSGKAQTGTTDDVQAAFSAAHGGSDGGGEAGPSGSGSASAASVSRRLYRRSISAPSESWRSKGRGPLARTPSRAEKGKGRMWELRQHEEDPAQPSSSGAPHEEAGPSNEDASEASSEQFVPLLLLWNRRDGSGDGPEQPGSSLERIPSVDGVGQRSASRRCVFRTSQQSCYLSMKEEELKSMNDQSRDLKPKRALL